MTLLESNRLYLHRSSTKEAINSIQIKISSLPNFKQNKTAKSFSPTLLGRILSITIGKIFCKFFWFLSCFGSRFIKLVRIFYSIRIRVFEIGYWIQRAGRIWPNLLLLVPGWKRKCWKTTFPKKKKDFVWMFGTKSFW